MDIDEKERLLSIAKSVIHPSKLFRISNEIKRAKKSQRLQYWQEKVLVELSAEANVPLEGVEAYLAIFGEYEYTHDYERNAKVLMKMESIGMNSLATWRGGYKTIDLVCQKGFLQSLTALANRIDQQQAVELHRQLTSLDHCPLTGRWREQFAELFNLEPSDLTGK